MATRDTARDAHAKGAVQAGYRLGKLTVVERTDQRRNGYAVWRCACDCGGEILLDTRTIRRGAVRDCGCSGVTAASKDLRGRRFGRLVCVEPTKGRSGDGGVIWRCRCDCGSECLAASTQLTRGFKKSCGCLCRPPLKDFIGRRFGALTVTGYAGKRNGKHIWRCACDCGGETEVAQSNLQNGHTKSCGCLQREVLRQNLKLVDGTSVTMIEKRMKAPIKSNTSGVNGVYMNRHSGKWIAQITFKGRTYFLGQYDELQDATKARRRGEEMYDRFLEWYYREHPSPEA